MSESKKSIEQRLADEGYGHRRTLNSSFTGKHEIYSLYSGAVIGEMTAHEACTLFSIDAQMSLPIPGPTQ